MDTGDQITTASISLNYLKPARDIDFHPYDNLIAFCSYDTNAPVYVFKYSSEKAAKELALHKSFPHNLSETKTLSGEGTLLQTVKNEKIAQKTDE